MSKELKALEQIGEYHIGEKKYGYDIKETRLYGIVEQALKEHEQYKTIEELCKKVIEKPIYEKFVDTHEIREEDYTDCSALYNFKHNRIEFYTCDFVNYLELDQYGKFWALTREELEK